ncbi:MerR family transcriptional regulator [Nocardia puris]|uniref:DNA-binding transcriptional MerR regulator n=1 Tax=Nocardia puris TaxID=208602 RepID=A0A366DYQ9_9NOCA|nr:MerR family transcriptional regulator [Nocardia puris]MBF6209929.1 MerR family transcriptional regulator [Nocardia puris]MBF6368121.1 MerR family transcriptional regulator [Nocardia puris]MBF6458160.1 MerR family transcriptional regulator [Nocardia puris]RBO94328.1 DNA-binding transcriptional MerR regulator [Nocardia puris]
MRISDVARAAGTTPRAVRHYHRLGLLAEPARKANGYRDYTAADLARLLRIRWLAENGLPLGSVAAVLAEGRDGEADDDIRADLRALVAGCERDIAVLTRKRDRLHRMLESATRGGTLTALPDEVVDAFERVRASTTDPRQVRALQQERDLLEVLAVSGAVPEEMLIPVTTVLEDDGLRHTYLRFLGEWESLRGKPVAECEPRIAALAAELAELLRERFTPEMFATRAEEADGLSVEDLIPDPAQRAVIVRGARALWES